MTSPDPNEAAAALQQWELYKDRAWQDDPDRTRVWQRDHVRSTSIIHYMRMLEARAFLVHLSVLAGAHGQELTRLKLLEAHLLRGRLEPM